MKKQSLIVGLVAVALTAHFIPPVFAGADSNFSPSPTSLQLAAAGQSTATQRQAKPTAPNKNQLTPNRGQWLIKANLGYGYNFGGGWTKSNSQSPSLADGTNRASGGGALAYGVDIGWTHPSGFGLSVDYLGFSHQWVGGGTGTYAATNYNYTANYHVISLVPHYRLRLDKNDNWGLQGGLGLGISISDLRWRQLAGGALVGANDRGRLAGGRAGAGAAYGQAFGTPPPFPCAAPSSSLSVILHDSSGEQLSPGDPRAIGSTHGVCAVLNPGMVSASAIYDLRLTDEAIAKWLITDNNARLGQKAATPGDPSPTGNGPIGVGVWTTLLSAASGDEAALTTLNNVNDSNWSPTSGGASGDNNPISTSTDKWPILNGTVTAFDAQAALRKLLGGYEGITDPWNFAPTTTAPVVASVVWNTIDPISQFHLLQAGAIAPTINSTLWNLGDSKGKVSGGTTLPGLNNTMVAVTTGLSDAQRLQLLRGGAGAPNVTVALWSQLTPSQQAAVLANGGWGGAGSVYGHDAWSQALTGAGGALAAQAINAYVAASVAAGVAITPADLTKLLQGLFAGGGAVTIPGDVWNRLDSNSQMAISAAGGVAGAPSGGQAKDDIGVVIAPQMAIDYDNGLFHADVTIKYLHALKDVKYVGSEDSGGGSASAPATTGSLTYTSRAGPLALFIGGGLGLNF